MKKFLALFLALIMTFGAFAINVSAAPAASNIMLGGKIMKTETYYASGTMAESSTKPAGGWAYLASDKQTLTLHDFELRGAWKNTGYGYSNATCYSVLDLNANKLDSTSENAINVTLVLEGVNRLTCTAGEPNGTTNKTWYAAIIQGTRYKTALTIKNGSEGEGVLYAIGEDTKKTKFLASAGMHINNLIMESGTVYSEGGDSYMSRGLSVVSKCTINGGKVYATSGDVWGHSSGALVTDAYYTPSLIINGGAVYANAGNTVKDTSLTGQQADHGKSFGVASNGLQMNGGQLQAHAGSGTTGSNGVRMLSSTHTVAINSGSVLVATSTGGKESPSIADHENNSILLKNITKGNNTLIVQNEAGTVRGSVTVKYDLELPNDTTYDRTINIWNSSSPVGVSLTVAQGATLTIPENTTINNDKTITNNGTIINNGTITNDGTMNNNGIVVDNSGAVIDNNATWNNSAASHVYVNNASRIDNVQSDKVFYEIVNNTSNISGLTFSGETESYENRVYAKQNAVITVSSADKHFTLNTSPAVTLTSQLANSINSFAMPNSPVVLTAENLSGVHEEETIPAVPPGCTTAGSTAGVKCSVCQLVLTEPKPIEELGHDFSAGYNRLTQNTHNFACKNCDEFGMNRADGPKVGDFDYCSFKNYADNGDGTHTGKCNCGNTVIDIHDWDKWKQTEGEISHTRVCLTCGTAETEACADEIINITGVSGQDCKCDICDRQLSHTFDQRNDAIAYLKSEADCTTPATYYMSCICGEKGTETFTVGTAKGHSWTASYLWADDYSYCTLTLTCSAGCSETHTDNTIEAIVTQNKTCKDDEMTVYKADFDLLTGYDEDFESETEEIKTGDAFGHDWTKADGTVNAFFDWSEDGTSCTVVFTCKNGCTDTYSDVKTTLTNEVKGDCENDESRTYAVTVTTSDGKATAEDSIIVYGEKGGHKLGEWIKEESNSCLEDGVKGHYTCSVCGKYFDGAHKEIADLTIPAHGHNYAEAAFFGWSERLPENYELPVCEAKQICVYDSSHVIYYTSDEVIVSEVEDRYVPEACTTEGEIYYVAEVVGYNNITYVTPEAHKYIIPALGHYDISYDGYCDRPTGRGTVCGEKLCVHNDDNYEIKHRVEATCTQDGYTGDKFCSECLTIRERGESIPALGHAYKVTAVNWDETYEAKSTPDCFVTFVCQNDRTHTETVKGVVTLVEGAGRVPTCTQDGIKYYSVSAVYDGAVFNYENPMGRTDYKKSYITEKSGHDFTVSYRWSIDGKTCDIIFTCAAGCTETVTKTFANGEITAVGGDEPTCEENGTTIYAVSGEYTDENDVEHSFGDSVERSDVEAKGHDFTGDYNPLDGEHNFACKNDCGEFGIGTKADAEINGTVECNYSYTSNGDGTHTAECDCGNSYSDNCSGGKATCIEKAVCDDCKTGYGELKAHSFTGSANTLENMKHNFHCAQKGCAAVGIGDTENAVADCNSFVLIESEEGTCNEKGYEIYKCGHCDNTKRVDTDVFGHVEGEWENTIPATCLNGGVDELRCELCGELLATRQTPASEHDLVTVEGQLGTCLQTGWAKYEYCKNCDYTTYKKLPLGEHVFSEWVVILTATCICHEIQTRECSICGEIQKRANTELGYIDHSYVIVEGKQPNCTEDGYRAYEKCKWCELSYGYNVIPALGHQDGNGDGICERCGYDDGSGDTGESGGESGGTTIPDGTHTHAYGEWETAKSATCTVNGQDKRVCATCGGIETRVVGAKGHSYGDDNICDTCGEAKPGAVTEPCDHLCHESGFMGFIWKIVQFFWKLFKMNPECSCGAAHY